MSKYRFDIPATDQNNLNKVKRSINNFKDKVIGLSLTQDQTNEVFKLTQCLIDTYGEAVDATVPCCDAKLRENLNILNNCLKKTLSDYNSTFKRRKEIGKYASFVPPEEKAIGFKWTQVFDTATEKIVRKYEQNTFQFVRPSATIQSLFSEPDFVKMYLESMNAHTCEKNVYKDYCCGSNFRQSQFFRDNPSAVKLQLYTDDFEPCDGLKSKAGKHKKCAFYMVIRNMPKKLQSKLSNIFLVALADSIDLKTESADISSILDVIIEDLKMLETVGVKTADGQIIKAALVSVCSDNLGFNVCFGFVQGFQANFFCRFCVCHKSECKQMTKEDSNKLRDMKTYKEICDRIAENGNLDQTETKGVRQYCKLNDLQNFDLFRNPAVDPMHDLLEGAVPFALHIVFDYCFEKKLFNPSQLDNMIQFFNYGALNKRNIPSKLKLKSKNLGQNATQLHCLIENLPFILYQYKNRLEEIWTLIQSLIQILQIVFSEELNEYDLICLETALKTHTGFIVNVLKEDLIPKHHLLLHYPFVIRTMGPAVFTSAMRLEAKHQELKSIAQKTKNFINLNKTIAEKHQISMSLKKNSFSDEIQPGRSAIPFENSSDFEIFKPLILLDGNEILVTSLKVNDLLFKPGLLLLHESIFFEVSHILCRSSNFWFLCENSYNVKQRDPFSNSLVLEDNAPSIHVIRLIELVNKRSYQKIYVDGKVHVFCDTLKVRST